MPVTYENLVRGVLLLLLIVGSITSSTVHPALTIISFIAFEYIIRKLEKPLPVKDHSIEVKALQDKINRMDEEFKSIKGDIGVAKIGSMIKRNT